MIRAQIIAPPACSDAVLADLTGDETVTNVVRFPGAAHRPAGDVILCDIAPEQASAVIHRLRRSGVLDDGAISLSETVAELSPGGTRAAKLAPGPEGDAVIWEFVESRVAADAELGATLIGLQVVAVMIGALALLTQSEILMVGAMVVGPEFAPIAGILVGLVLMRGRLTLTSAGTLLLACLIAVVVCTGFVGLLRLTGVAPDRYDVPTNVLSTLVGTPDWSVVLVAALAGVAGILAMTTAHAGALVGVLISVATVPSMAGIATALVYGQPHDAGQAALALAANVGGILVAGVVTLAVQRQAFARRYRAHRLRPPGR